MALDREKREEAKQRAVTLARESLEKGPPRTINQIARDCGLSWKATEAAIHAAGLDLAPARYAKRDVSRERNREIVWRYTQGEKITKLAAAYGVSKQRISQIIRKDRE